MTIYPTPDSSNAAKNLHIFLVKRIQDAGTYSNATDVPYRFIPPMVFRFSFLFKSQNIEWKKHNPLNYYTKMNWHELYRRMDQQSSTYITPKAYYPNI